ncbi:hypothetical protein KEH51_02430 [[Brevibacterium] frigoritolerans]|uniref:Uncharacterized protein n=1 Tax=Peribacillus frigoritolerans TaxID=450367 RepID=A0A941FHC7_9BACI|nr:hypothetical protein [Peribacillus frigoritolerans]
MLFNHGFEGFTLLRMSYLFDDEGNPTNEFRMMADKLEGKSIPVTFTVENVPATQGVYLIGNRGKSGDGILKITNINSLKTQKAAGVEHFV